MRLYLDSFSSDAWSRWMPSGLFHGITTNPLLAEKAGAVYKQTDWATRAKRAADVGAQEIHFQAHGPATGYARFADTILSAGQAAGIRTVVKVPLVPEGIAQVPTLKAMGCPILMTACYDAKQMFVAAALQADYIAPYFGRMLEGGLPAYDALDQMRAIAAQPDVKTRVMVASLRTTEQMCRLAAQGHDCFTLSADLAETLTIDPMSTAAVAAFETAAKAGA